MTPHSHVVDSVTQSRLEQEAKEMEARIKSFNAALDKINAKIESYPKNSPLYEKLNSFVFEILKLKASSEPFSNVMEALDNTQKLLEGGMQTKDYLQYAKKFEGRNSKTKKLGVIMMFLGAIIFAVGLALCVPTVGVVGSTLAMAGAGIGGCGLSLSLIHI